MKPNWQTVRDVTLYLCVPLIYQCSILLDEFHNGIATEILFKTEPHSDLPAVTICVPHVHLFNQSFINQIISRAANEDNLCVEWRRSAQRLESRNFSMPEYHFKTLVYMSKKECYDRNHLTARDRHDEALMTLQDVIGAEYRQISLFVFK